MSKSLSARPVPKDPPPAEYLEYGLIRVLAEDLLGVSQSDLYDSPHQISLEDDYARGFINGLVSAGYPGADELLAMLQKHRTIEVWTS